MSWKVSKDNGQTIHEIEEDYDPQTGLDRSLEAAKAKGYKPFVSVTKNGKDVFNIEGTSDSVKAAYDKGYQDVDSFQFTHEDPKKKISKIDSTYKGAIHGASQGFIDEVAGGTEALGSLAGVRGLGGDWGDIHRATPEESQQSFGDSYRQGRDKRRLEDQQAQEANPKSYMAGNIGGGVATGGPLGGATLKGALALGAAAGLGDSDADLTKGDVGGALIDTTLGAGAGALGHGLGKAVGSAIEKGPITAAKDAWGVTKTLTGAAKDGAKELSKDAPAGTGVVASALGALKGVYNELKQSGIAKEEFGSIAQEAKKIIGNAGAKDDEAVLAALMSDGDNGVKRWFAERSATLNPGAHTAEDYSKILGMDSEARQAARAFNPKEAAKTLKPDIENVEDLFHQARNQRYTELQDAARGQFDPKVTAPVVSHLEGAIEDAGALKSVPSSVSNLLDDVHGMVTAGKGTKLQGLTPGDLASASPAEQFNRLQKARELLDSKIKWASREGESQSEGLLRGARDSIDQALKTSPDKVEGDALWRTSKQLEDKFFDATKFGKKGSYDVDESKISRLLGGTDTAKRFSSTLQEMKDFANRPDLSPEFREKMAGVIKSMEDKMGVAEQQRTIGSFRYKQGPSSPAIERLQSASGNNSLLKDAVNAPSGFLNSIDSFNQTVKQRLGKSFNDLTPEQKLSAAKFWSWSKANEGASATETDAMWKKLVK